MGGKDDLRSSLEKENPKIRGGQWHSRSYHRFFEGYSEVTVPKTNGKGYKIQRIYTGDYFRQELTKKQRVLLRLLYLGLYIGAVFLFISSATSPISLNTTWYVVIAQVICVPFLFWLGLVFFFFYLPAHQDMTIHDYRSSSPPLMRSALGASLSLAVAAFAVLVNILINPSQASTAGYLCFFQYLVSGLLLFGINRVEKKVNYGIVPNPNVRVAQETEEKKD